MKNHIAPVLFIGHGSPLNAINDNEYTRSLKDYTKSIIIPKAIVVISAHWQTYGTFITGSGAPDQIYDFYGFPEVLYNIKYKPSGLPEIAELFVNDKIGIEIDDKRGIDHAGWAVVKHIFPDGEIPLLEISLDMNKTPSEHFEFSKKLAKYRKQNILFIGSGNIIHNLYEIDFDENSTPYSWASEIDNWFKEKIQNYDTDKIINYKNYIKNHKLAIPTNEHYLPLLYTLGMKFPEENINTIHESIQNASISMRSFEIYPTNFNRAI
jgi:4,5-DOPA dioxygenase extradiol